jgi:hypothetical protein
MSKPGLAKVLLLSSLWLLFLAPPWISCVRAQTTAGPEKQKIEALITRVGGLPDAKFVRNGSSYEGSSAVRFLRGKWAVNAAAVKTAQDFIDKVASVSGTSNKPYLIRFNDGREMTSRDFLIAELNKIERAMRGYP